MSVTLEFFTTLAWRDERLSFQHLTPGKETPVPATQADRMWIPDFQLDLEGGQPKVLDEKVMITTANNATLPASDISRNRKRPHSDSPVHREVRLFLQPPHLPLRQAGVQHQPPALPRLPGPGQLLARGLDRDLHRPRGTRSLYGQGVAFRSTDDARTELSLGFELHRRQGVILLSTFVPSVLLLLVSWAALFLKDLNVSANLSLTNLLVLYTLFSNLLRSVPDTAAVKMIDIWFFFAISLLFLNIMVIIFLDYVAGFFLNAQTERAPRTRVSKRYERIMSLNHVTEILSFDWLFSIFGFSTKVIKTRNSCTRSSFLPRNHEEEEGENQGKQVAEGRSDLTGRRIERYLRAGQWNPRTSPLSAVYISATLEHILRRILAQSMAWADAMKRVRITPLFIALAVKADPDLNDLLGNTMFKDGRPAEFVAVF
ncbi:putative gamma-aminobutyric acid receptor subunit delta [Penaeus vannamei]|uniref:Putative gamma-aminobutyric acid receptor subunit delta n=1 Tax=Penaeus vannamei TaxID=6689 RepID=A0A3R7QIH1_PENVA|nr:putative gamma-aminobutyric acid receptor subunit delta [Penaeus vannamei]